MTTAVDNNNHAALAAALSGRTERSVGDGTSVAEMSDRFLKLLVTQLKNQDPMNPMENAELTTQLAQMSTVEGVNRLNDTMDGLAAQFRASQVLQGSALLGRAVLAEGDGIILTEDGAMGGIELDGVADKVEVRIYDENGAAVRTLTLGKQEAGLVRFAWDGLDAAGEELPAGLYSFKVTATADGEAVKAATYTLGEVLSVAFGDGGMEAEVSGVGTRTLEKIRQIF